LEGFFWDDLKSIPIVIAVKNKLFFKIIFHCPILYLHNYVDFLISPLALKDARKSIEPLFSIALGAKKWFTKKENTMLKH